MPNARTYYYTKFFIKDDVLYQREPDYITQTFKQIFPFT